MISQDLTQRIKVGAIFLLQIYKVTTGTMLSLFVPQACSSDGSSSEDDECGSGASAGEVVPVMTEEERKAQLRM